MGWWGRCLALGLALWFFFLSPVGAEDYNKRSLIGMNFAGQDLTDSSFVKAVLRQANFQGADLRGVSFFWGEPRWRQFGRGKSHGSNP